jgi:hypothetical protein
LGFVLGIGFRIALWRLMDVRVRVRVKIRVRIRVRVRVRVRVRNSGRRPEETLEH